VLLTVTIPTQLTFRQLTVTIATLSRDGIFNDVTCMAKCVAISHTMLLKFLLVLAALTIAYRCCIEAKYIEGDLRTEKVHLLSMIILNLLYSNAILLL